MADPTANITVKTRPRPGQRTHIITNAVQLFAGALVGWSNVDGFLDFFDNLALTRFAGLCLEDKLGNTSATPAVRARVDESGAVLREVTLLGTPTQAKVGEPVYTTDGNFATLTLTAGVSPAIGIMADFKSVTDQDVQLFTPTEFAAAQL